jgi:two-component system chemotaxis response regulator CheB
MRALVIDDSKPVRSILARMLRELDFETSEAANGQAGLQLLRELGKPDVATVNWQMPEMDGLQFIRAVRSDARYRELPLLMISSESEPSRVATALAAGANEYIIKPCTQQALAEKLARLGLSAAQSSTTGRAWPTENHTRGGRTIRVLIVDDSVVVRRVVSSVLSDDPDLEVVGTAADGRIALERLAPLDPDVVLLDVEMPNLNGLETLKALRKTHPRMAVIMFSSLTERGAAVTTDALLLGANDYVAKPGGTHMKDPEAGRRTIREELIPKIKQLSLGKTRLGGIERIGIPATRAAGSTRRVDVVVIASSTGGPCALAQMLPQICPVPILPAPNLPAPILPVPILIVQHMPPLFTKHLADRLADRDRIDIREGAEGDILRPGQVRIAPGGFHMTVSGRADGGRLRLSQDPPVNACRPSADVLFRSAVELYGGHTLAVVLTGMGNDGLLGCKCIQQAGGQILVQDELTSAVWGMPGQVARAGLADEILPLAAIGTEIARRVRKHR